MKQSKMLQAYKSPILGQLLDLISPTEIGRFEPKFESYDQWNMANSKGINGSSHKSERTDAASASLYSYPGDSNPRAAYKKITKKFF